ncbi:MAG TPA: hypothetical protein VFS65_02565 [Candidatus Saccharimonadales bacterium]|nr:hypothetical protein [Candidatus Saccharimonadales bacterium]
MKKTLKASSLRTTMAVIIYLIIGLIGAGFYYAQDWLQKEAAAVGQVVAQSTAGDGNTQAVEALRAEIAERQPAAIKAESIMMSSQTWRTQIVQDLNRYAAKTGITITNYDFAKTDAAAATSPAASNTAPLLAGGLQTASINITLQSPIEFSSLMKFIKEIENSIPKMQISGIVLNRSEGSNAVTVQPLTITVYTR